MLPGLRSVARLDAWPGTRKSRLVAGARAGNLAAGAQACTSLVMNQLARLSLIGAWAALGAACAATPAATKAPELSARPAAAPEPTSAAPSAEPELEIPPAPASCQRHAASVPAKVACGADTARALANALAAPDAERDRLLNELEACSEITPGVLRALRIELAPTECGDVLAEPWLARSAAGQRTEVTHALRGLSLAARANRLVRDPPALEPPLDKQRVVEFLQTTLADWIRRQARAVHAVSLSGAALDGYGKALVAVEAGLADMRFVEVVRAAPVPDEIRKQKDLADVYFATLDDSLEPRKTRGRDAALVGLGKLAEIGVISDPRLNRARALLSEVYSGRRIDALDHLLLPDPPASKRGSVEEQIVSQVPTFYAPLLVPGLDATRPSTLRALLERGLPAEARATLDGAKLSPETERLYARALFELGRTYWRAADFARARERAARQPRGGADLPLVAGLSEILARGPQNAAEMILSGPHLPSALAEVAPLDAIAKDHRSLAGYAAYDAALLLELARPPSATAAYFEAIAQRYASAAKQLPPAHRARAAERARAARDTAKAVVRP
jgi:hypothetical protein